MAADHINRLVTSEAVPINLDIDNSIRLTRRKKARPCVLPRLKQHGKKTLKHHGVKHYCMLCKKVGISDTK